MNLQGIHLLVGVMPEGDEVVMISERQDALAVLLWNWKQVLQDACDLKEDNAAVYQMATKAKNSRS